MKVSYAHLLAAALAGIATGKEAKIVGYAEIDLDAFNKRESQGRGLRGQKCKRLKHFNTTVLVEHGGSNMDKDMPENELFALSGSFLETYNDMTCNAPIEDSECDPDFRRVDYVEAQAMGSFRKMVTEWTFIETRLVLYHCMIRCSGNCNEHFHLFDHNGISYAEANPATDETRELKQNRGHYKAPDEIYDNTTESCFCPHGMVQLKPSMAKFLQLFNTDIQNLLLDPDFMEVKVQKLKEGRDKQREKLRQKEVEFLEVEELVTKQDLEDLKNDNHVEFEALKDKHALLEDNLHAKNEADKRADEDAKNGMVAHCMATTGKDKGDCEDEYKAWYDPRKAAREQAEKDMDDAHHAAEDLTAKQHKAAEDAMAKEVEICKKQVAKVDKNKQKMDELEIKIENEKRDFLEKMDKIYAEFSLYTTAATDLVELKEVPCNTNEITDFKREVDIDYYPHPDLSNKTVKEALEFGFMYSYNNLSAVLCDPLHREITKVRFKEVEVDVRDRRQLGTRKKRLRLQADGTCLGCDDGSGLFNDGLRRLLGDSEFGESEIGESEIGALGPHPLAGKALHHQVRQLIIEDGVCLCPIHSSPSMQRAPAKNEVSKAYEADDALNGTVYEIKIIEDFEPVSEVPTAAPAP